MNNETSNSMYQSGVGSETQSRQNEQQPLLNNSGRRVRGNSIPWAQSLTRLLQSNRSSGRAGSSDNLDNVVVVGNDELSVTSANNNNLTNATSRSSQPTSSQTTHGPVQFLSTLLGDQRSSPILKENAESSTTNGQHQRKGSLIRTGSRGLSRVGSRSEQLVCLICFGPLVSEDFETGEAIQLDCSCKGDVAMRHRSCAIQWSKVKGDNVCDICKKPILNIPTPSHSAASSDAGDLGDGSDNARPGPADYIFDCIRVSWVAMIICILFLNFTLSKAFLSGVIVGLVYMLFCKVISALHFNPFRVNSEGNEGEAEADDQGGEEQTQGEGQGENVNPQQQVQVNDVGARPQLPQLI
eukprot:TRINITY_DN1291_c0_g1_i4.p2 TRINITY_DN1291_c0_g1~~TRINITY_DN1291_c0_g1_i4.p2  ORF type:complete len:354 (-),score=46.72 TRINITY_DN1291_c0_g1_i4:740-1801(-)